MQSKKQTRKEQGCMATTQRKTWRPFGNNPLTKGPGPRAFREVVSCLTQQAQGEDVIIPIHHFGTCYREMPVRISGFEILNGNVLVIYGRVDLTEEKMTRSKLHGVRIRVQNYKPKNRTADFIEAFH